MNLVVALSAIMRMAGVLLVLSVLGPTSSLFFGIVDPNLVELTVQGEPAIWRIAGNLLPAGFLWIYACEISRWIIGNFDRPLESGIRAAALFYVAVNISTVAVSTYFILNPVDHSIRDQDWYYLIRGSAASEVATLLLFGLAVALIFATPKIGVMVAMRKRVLELRAKIESEDL